MRPPRLPAPLLADVVVGVLLAIWWAVEVRDLSGLGVASLILCTGPLAWRRLVPFPVVVLVAGGLVLGAAERVPAEPLAQLVAVLIAPYSVAVHAARTREAVAGGAVTAAAGVASGLIIGDDVLFITLLVGSAWAVGFGVRRLLGRSAELEERAALLDERARVAATDERERIARELHDIVSHSVSLMVVQAGAAEQVMREDPEQAARALRALQSTGRAAVDDLRRMLGLLRGGDGTHPLAPQPGLASLPDLMAGFVESGMPLDADHDGPLPQLPTGIDLAAFRIVQESLTNAARHAPGRATRVRISTAEGRLEIEVRTDDAPAPLSNGNGHGLIGMRERVHVYGGDLRVGPDGSDWVVKASIPVPSS